MRKLRFREAKEPVPGPRDWYAEEAGVDSGHCDSEALAVYLSRLSLVSTRTSAGKLAGEGRNNIISFRFHLCGAMIIIWKLSSERCEVFYKQVLITAFLPFHSST